MVLVYIFGKELAVFTQFFYIGENIRDIFLCNAAAGILFPQ